MNIACGLHAGDPHTMHELVAAALKAGVADWRILPLMTVIILAAAPWSFHPKKVYDLIVYQVGALQAFLQVHGAGLRM